MGRIKSAWQALTAPESKAVDLSALIVPPSSSGIIVSETTALMVWFSPRLAARCTIRPSRYLITDKPTRSEYKAIPADASLKHGLDASAVVYDELHVAPSRDLYDVLSTAFGSRSQPMFFIPTTAGWNRKSVLWEVHEEGKAVLDGLMESPAFLPVIYAADEDADWTDETVWHEANPGLGDFRSIDEMREKFEAALLMPRRENSFRQLHLNQWTQQAERWLSMALWRKCGDPLRELNGRECFAAIDLSATTDLTAVTYFFPDDDGSFDIACDFFLPDHNLKRRGEQDRVPYLEWVDDGFLIATPGQVVDYDMVAARISERGEGFDIVGIEYDAWSAAAIVKKLEEEGFTLNKFRQNFERMSPPAKHLERLLIEIKLRHGGNPILEWMAGNVAVKRDAGDNIRPVKPHDTARIDGIVSLVMSIGGYLKAPPREASPYEERGILFV
jgi:phage terminase large subunit-like protein